MQPNPSHREAQRAALRPPGPLVRQQSCPDSLTATWVPQALSFHPGQGAGRPRLRVSGGGGSVLEVGPGVAAQLLFTPWAENQGQKATAIGNNRP